MIAYLQVSISVLLLSSMYNKIATNDNIMIALISLFSSLIGALIAQLFQFVNIKKTEIIRVSGIFAQDKYTDYKKLLNLVCSLLTHEYITSVHLGIEISEIKDNPQKAYHIIFSSWDAFDKFYNDLADLFKNSHYIYTKQVYILYIVFTRYWRLLHMLAGGVYQFGDIELRLFGLYCFRDIEQWRSIMEHQCYRMINKPNFKITFAYNFIYRFYRKIYFRNYYLRTKLVDLYDRFMKLDGTKDIKYCEYPAMFDNWYNAVEYLRNIPQ